MLRSCLGPCAPVRRPGRCRGSRPCPEEIRECCACTMIRSSLPPCSGCNSLDGKARRPSRRIIRCRDRGRFRQVEAVLDLRQGWMPSDGAGATAVEARQPIHERGISAERDCSMLAPPGRYRTAFAHRRAHREVGDCEGIPIRRQSKASLRGRRTVPSGMSISVQALPGIGPRGRHRPALKSGGRSVPGVSIQADARLVSHHPRSMLGARRAAHDTAVRDAEHRGPRGAPSSPEAPGRLGGDAPNRRPPGAQGWRSVPSG
jgi:hypothetical protein